MVKAVKICSENDRRICTRGAGLRVCYMLAGYPSCGELPELLRQAETGMPDIWEIGFPSPDPCGDGEVIRRAHAEVDRAAACQPEYWRTLRAATRKPIWLMGYHRDLAAGGAWRALAAAGLVDALVVPDCPDADRLRLRDEAAALGVDVLGFVTPEMDEAQVDRVLHTYPLVYVQLYSGMTGMTGAPDLSQEMARRVCGRGDALTFAGFGIRTAEKMHRLLALGFDGAVIGTETMRQLGLSPGHLAGYLRSIGR